MIIAPTSSNVTEQKMAISASLFRLQVVYDLDLGSLIGKYETEHHRQHDGTDGKHAYGIGSYIQNVVNMMGGNLYHVLRYPLHIVGFVITLQHNANIHHQRNGDSNINQHHDHALIEELPDDGKGGSTHGPLHADLKFPVIEGVFKA